MKCVEVNNKVTPNEAQMQGFLEQGHDDPIYMLNLLKFKGRAEYEDGRDSQLTGEQAYRIYSQAVAGLLLKAGGAPVFSASVERLMLGEVEDLWDSAAIAMYPSRQAMLNMISSPEYQEIAVHRSAGLEGQLNIELVNPLGGWFTEKGAD